MMHVDSVKVNAHSNEILSMTSIQGRGLRLPRAGASESWGWYSSLTRGILKQLFMTIQ